MLPAEFRDRMTALLGDQAKSFFEEIENNAPVRSFRVNNIKITREEFEEIDPFIERKKADFPPECYYTEEKFPGSLPCHHAGMIYMQDPSAMATVHAVKIDEGMKILDACAAPGGKTTQLSAAAGESGAVVANEYDTKRCRILQSNVERMGCVNTVVVNLDTAMLAETYPEKFDVVLADAPCSGEGMFRKNSLAVDEWSVDNVIMCAERQREILTNVAKCVAFGGALIYSTCTFSLEENEKNVDWFLSSHPEFELCDVEPELKKATSDGINFEGAVADMRKARRFYPHISHGEGQFIAVMRKTAENGKEYSEGRKRKEKSCDVRKKRQEIEDLALAKEFLEENLVSAPDLELKVIGEKVFLCPDINLPKYSVFCAGVCVGEVLRGRLVPHHQLFSAFGKLFLRQIMLTSTDKRTADYLAGMEISAEDVVCLDGAKHDGWAAVLVDNVALGGGKISNRVCKNHYPKGLRNQR